MRHSTESKLNCFIVSLFYFFFFFKAHKPNEHATVVGLKAIYRQYNEMPRREWIYYTPIVAMEIYPVTHDFDHRIST